MVATMSIEERKKRRLAKRQAKAQKVGAGGLSSVEVDMVGDSDGRIAALLSRNEDELLNFVAKVNKIYLEKLGKPAPFMTFVLCGMQSAGKSTIMERFLGAVLNIVQEGTGTRCPLDTTCIHDNSCTEPKCNLSGKELEGGGENLSVARVFQVITEHNKKLGREDRFSTEPLRLEYRANNVQNMRFVDTPGIITNKSTGMDNRDDIKTILQSEMSKPNTKLCVLLEPKEFATNSIVDFCDESLGGRDKWISNATFLMNKFDKQLGDSRVASKANAFFAEYHNNKCFPYLVYTPNLLKENLPTQELFDERNANLATADRRERDLFSSWEEGHRRFKADRNGDDEDLLPEVKTRLGFPTAKKEMREIMLRDTAERIPEVLQEMRHEMEECLKEYNILKEKLKFSDPIQLQAVVAKFLRDMERRILAYLDGDMNSAMKFPDKLQTLEAEIDGEEESDWTVKSLNHHTESEEKWRERVAVLDLPERIQPDATFLGGKQYQRALLLFKEVMIEALPDPFALQKYAATGAGYLSGGLQRENWEHSMRQITGASLKDITHPGINYLVKHAGYILRRLFSVALDDIKKGEEFSATYMLMPSAVEDFVKKEYDKMLWGLMQNAANMINQFTEAMYSTIDPNLPTFHVHKSRDSAIEEEKDAADEGYIAWMAKRMKSLRGTSEAKDFLREDSNDRANRKKAFLSDERTSMVTSAEVTEIIKLSFQYIVALMEHLMIGYTFQLNHFLYEAFKQALGDTFMNAMNRADWKDLCKPDENAQRRLEVLKDRIESLTESLEDVQRLNVRA